MQPTVRQINAHVFAGSGYCVVYANSWQARIGWARTRKGITEGRVINVSGDVPAMKEDHTGLSWITIPNTATIELSQCQIPHRAAIAIIARPHTPVASGCVLALIVAAPGSSNKPHKRAKLKHGVETVLDAEGNVILDSGTRHGFDNSQGIVS